jgi:hypothetical protein
MTVAAIRTAERNSSLNLSRRVAIRRQPLRRAKKFSGAVCDIAWRHGRRMLPAPFVPDAGHNAKLPWRAPEPICAIALIRNQQFRTWQCVQQGKSSFSFTSLI